MHETFTLPKQYSALVLRLKATQRPVIIMDGGSGAGKTELANRLFADLSETMPDLQLIGLDDFFPGWHGLAAASRLVPDLISGRADGYRRWDWTLKQDTEPVTVNSRKPMLVVGCGALTPASAALATDTIWYEMARDARKKLALERDGETYRDWWDVWEAQEQQHWRTNHPQDLASIWVSRNLG